MLITGGAGFIGSNLAKYFSAKGYPITILDNLSTGNLENLNGSTYSFIHGDIRDKRDVAVASEYCKIIIHCAAYVSVPGSIKNSAETIDININGTINVLDRARYNDAMVIFASSSGVYGNTKYEKIPEDAPHYPTNPYTASKSACESIINSYRQSYGSIITTLRYFNVWGPNQSATGPYSAVIPNFIDSVLNNRRPTIYGNGKQTRDFCHVHDVCRANNLAINTKANDTINIGSGGHTSINELLAIINEVAGSSVKANYSPARLGDIFHSCADITKATELLGYQPKVSIYDGIRSLVELYR